MSDYLDKVKIYETTCGLTQPCPARPTNDEAAAFDNAYQGWLDRFTVTDPNFPSFVMEDPAQVSDPQTANKAVVHSESLAYKLYFSVLADDYQTFNETFELLEKYAVNKNGLYAWRLSANGTVLEEHSATDADLYAAAAITLAYAKWQDNRYANTAQRLKDAIWEHDTFEHRGYRVLKPSDHAKLFVHGDGRFIYNPSYFAPSLIRILASVDRNPKHDWNKVIQDGYSLLSAIVTASSRLKTGGHNPIPDWVLANISGGNFYIIEEYQPDVPESIGTPQYGFDAIRVYLELARDRAVAPLDSRAKMIADLILNRLPLHMPAPPTPFNVELADENNPVAVASYGLLHFASSRPNSDGEAYLAELRGSAYHHDFIGRNVGPDRESYYYQSLLLHATSILGGYTFEPAKLKGLFTYTTDYEDYTPYRIYAERDGSVYVNHTLIHQYKESRQGKSPYVRAYASAKALKKAYLAERLRPKHIAQDSDSDHGAMSVDYGWFRSEDLFEFGPEDFNAPKSAAFGHGLITQAYREMAGASYEDQPELKYEDEAWYHTAAQMASIEARLTPLELTWDLAYGSIYTNLNESGIVDFRKEAEDEIENPTTLEELSIELVDYFLLTRAARGREVASYTRAYDDMLSLRRYIDSFLSVDPHVFPKPIGYYEALFSIGQLLADQDNRYEIEYMYDELEEIETWVKCHEARLRPNQCQPFSAPDNPIEGLTEAETFIEAAAMIFEYIIQSDVDAPGFKARAFRENANVSFRLQEKGAHVTDRREGIIPFARDTVIDYLAALEDLQSQATPIVTNWRLNSAHTDVKDFMLQADNYYGLAQEYTNASYNGDEYEIIKICINLGKLYMFTHAPDDRIFSNRRFWEIREKGLKEAEIWFDFIVSDPEELFEADEFNQSKIEAMISLAEARMHLGFFSEAEGRPRDANMYFRSALKLSAEAYRRIKAEIHRADPEDWANEGYAMKLRGIYFNVLSQASYIMLRLADYAPQLKLKGYYSNPAAMVTRANAFLAEAFANKELIIFGSTKKLVYLRSIHALFELATRKPDPRRLPIRRLQAILEIDAQPEGSFEFFALQTQAMAFLAYHCLETTPDAKAAERKFTKMLPWKKISNKLRDYLNLKDTDLEKTPDAFKKLLTSFKYQPTNTITETMRERFIKETP
ncbi:glycosyl hydrolase family 8 [Candidatus Margulisiibacteriota bacterium]